LELNRAEKKIVTALTSGAIAELSAERPTKATAINTIRTAALREIVIGKHLAHTDWDPHGLQIKGAFIDGDLDLKSVRLDRPILLEACKINGKLIIAQANLYSLGLQGSQCSGIYGGGVHVARSLMFTNGFQCDGELDLINANIGANLNLGKARIYNKGEDALSCDRAHIKGSVFLRGTDIKGAIRFPNAEIGANFAVDDALLSHPTGDALALVNAQVNGDFAIHRSLIFGSVALSSLRCALDVMIAQTVIDASERLLLARISADNASELSDPVRSLRMRSVDVKGEISLNGAFWGETAIASSTIGRDISLKDGWFICNAAIVKSPASSQTSYADKDEIIRSAYFSSSGHKDCLTDTMNTKVGTVRCFSADGTYIGNNLFMREETAWYGTVSLEGVTCKGIHNSNDGSTKTWPQSLSIGSMKYDAFIGASPKDATSIREWLSRGPKARGVSFDSTPWDQAVKVLRNAGRRSDARHLDYIMEKRLDQETLPWKNISWKDLPKKFLMFLYRNLAGYGQKPLRTVLAMFLLWFFSWVVFDHAANRGIFAPSSPLVFQREDLAHCSPKFLTDVSEAKAQKKEGKPLKPEEIKILEKAEKLEKAGTKTGNWYDCAAMPGEYSTFSPPLYALDIILPLVNLQQENDWAPYIDSPDWTVNHWVRILVWINILAGWFGSLLLVASLTELMRHRD
jgi:hypothetical protein